MAIAAPGWCSNADEDGIGSRDRRGKVPGEGKPACRDIAEKEVMKTRLVDRDLALPKPLDLARVLVDAGDLVAEVGEADAGDEAHIAGSDHGEFHGRCLMR